MHRFLLLTVLFTGAAVVTPVAMMADDHHDSHEKRYYDKDGRDYHAWNDHEDRAYRLYLGEQHREYREFNRNNARQQREYFRWRHEHSDGVLFKVEIR
jgi:hypothetical protein